MDVTIYVKGEIDDILYQLSGTKICEYQIRKIKVEHVESEFGPSDKIWYITRYSENGCEYSIKSEDVGVKYFFDKKEILKKIVDQI